MKPGPPEHGSDMLSALLQHLAEHDQIDSTKRDLLGDLIVA